jgi:hypothetical protein
MLILWTGCSFEEPIQENSIYSTYFSERLLKHVVVVNRTLVYKPKSGSFTEIIKFGIPKYEWKYEIYVADQRNKSINKIGQIDGHSFLASRILELGNNSVLIELVDNQGSINKASTFKIGFDGSIVELKDKKREMSMSELNQISNLRLNQNNSTFEINKNNALTWINH